MQYRTLGRTGIKVSPYALGAMMFGALGNTDHDDSIRIIHRALDAACVPQLCGGSGHVICGLSCGNR
jgi:hypothetical protein